MGETMGETRHWVLIKSRYRFFREVFDLGFLQGYVRGVFELPTKKRSKIQQQVFLRR
jgi:hypothetical protein